MQHKVNKTNNRARLYFFFFCDQLLPLNHVMEHDVTSLKVTVSRDLGRAEANAALHTVERDLGATTGRSPIMVQTTQVV